MRFTSKDDLQTIEWLAKIRWPHGIICPSCKSTNISNLVKSRGIWQCRSCRFQFGIFKGTCLEGTRLTPFELIAAITFYLRESSSNFDYWAVETLPRRNRKIRLGSTQRRWRGPIGVRALTKGVGSYATAQRLHLKLRNIRINIDVKLEEFLTDLFKELGP